MSNLRTEIHTALEEIQAKLDSQNDLSSSDMEMLLLSALLEEEA